MAKKSDIEDIAQFDALLEKAGLNPREIDPDRPEDVPYPDELEAEEEGKGEEEGEGEELPGDERDEWERKLDKFLHQPDPFLAAAKRAEPSPVQERGVVSHVLSPERPVSALARQLTDLPTPGGLAPWIAILVVLLFALVPVNSFGDTRLSLIWRGLTGGASLPPSALSQELDQQAQQSTDPVSQEIAREASIAQQELHAFWQVLPGVIPIGGGAADPAWRWIGNGSE